MHVDYIIVGQGICGSLLSHQLIKAGKKIVVIDQFQPHSAGMVASGLINPVTGMRVAASWMVQELLPFAAMYYRELEQELGVKLSTSYELLDFHANLQSREIYVERLNQGAAYLKTYRDDDQWKPYFHFNYGISAIEPCSVIDMKVLQQEWRKYLVQRGMLIEEAFTYDQCILNEGVIYKDITAEKIIFCEGSSGMQNPWFSLLPYSLNKGEALIVRIPGLPRTHILKQGLKIVPWEDDLFWVGSSFEWKYDNLLPSETFRSKAEQQLRFWLKLPFTIEQHMASERPATVDHKPFVGFHPLYPQLGILNGMGAKGCLQTPYFAKVLSGHLCSGTTLNKEADVARYNRVLSR